MNEAAETDSDLPTGIVIGHFNCVNFLELNLAMLRRHCPGVPILVSDDCSNALSYTATQLGVEATRPILRELTDRYEAELVSTPARRGHQLGDWSALLHGIEWAGRRRLKVLYKLSQRCIVDRPGWPAEFSRLLTAADSDLQTPLIDWSHRCVMTYFLGLRLGKWTDRLQATKPPPRTNMERHMAAIVKKLALKTQLLDSATYSIFHRLNAGRSRFAKLAAGCGTKLQFGPPFELGARCFSGENHRPTVAAVAVRRPKLSPILDRPHPPITTTAVKLPSAGWLSQEDVRDERVRATSVTSATRFRDLDFYRDKKILLWTRKPGLGDRVMNAICCQLLRDRHGLDVWFGYWGDPSDRELPQVMADVPHYEFRPDLKRFPLGDHVVPRGYLAGRDHTGAEHPFDFIIDFRYHIHAPYNTIFQCLMEFGVRELTLPIPGLRVRNLPPATEEYDVVLCTSCGGWKPVRAYRRHGELTAILRDRGLKVLDLAETNVRNHIGSAKLLSIVQAAKVYVGAETGPTHLVSGVHRQAVIIQSGIHNSAFWNVYDRTHVVEARWECGGRKCRVRKHAECRISEGVCVDRFDPGDLADVISSYL